MRESYFIVIPVAGAEPMAVCAKDAAEVRRSLSPIFGDVALIAATTIAALFRAGWNVDTIHVAGEPMRIDETFAA